MSNMSYCRFENTLRDLEDCLEHMNDKDLSLKEMRERERLIHLCVDIAVDFGDEIDRPCEEM